MSLQARITDREISYGELIDHIKVTHRSNPEKSRQVATEYVNNHLTLFNPRTKSRIQDLPRLIRELETKEYVNVTNIVLLSDIVRALNSVMVNSLLVKHQRLLEEKSIPLPVPSVNNNIDKLPPRVRKYLEENIGKKWAQLAHIIGMPDAQVDELERYSECWRKVNTTLSFFEENTPKEEQIVKLIKALNFCKRKDLAEKVEEISANQ